MIQHVDRRRDLDRKTAMQMRRKRQRERTPGFTPVVNRKIQAAVTATKAALMADNPDLTSFQAERRAWAIFGKTLAPLAIGVKK